LNAKEKQLLLRARNLAKTASAKISSLEQEKKRLERENECYKIASDMMEKNLIAPEDFLKVATDLFNSGKPTELLKEAVAMNSGSNGLRLTIDVPNDAGKSKSLPSDALKYEIMSSFIAS
jgi:hypothetical protein